MDVRAELSVRRLASALVLVALLPAVLTAAAVTYQRPHLPPGPPAYNPLPLNKAPVLVALQARELQRSRRLTTQAAQQAATALVPATFPEPLPTLVLAPRTAEYTLAELRATFPQAFGQVGDATLARASIEVPTGAHLSIDGATTPDVRLASSPSGFATIISRGGTVDIAGTAAVPVRIASWDEAASTYDSNPDDGRAFLLTFGGRMNIAHADIGYLGFGTGTSSGVAWRGESHVPGSDATKASGTVTSSIFHHNWFGAYTFEAEGMHWTGNTFADNAAYGFDPHDYSSDFVVEGNVARGNGRHGFIFSRGCDRNILKNNVAYDNRGHGFMIDDGRSEDSDYAEAARVPSNDNQIINNRAYGNDGSGVEIEGGTGNVVRGNVLERNHVGVRIKDDASVAVSGNVIANSRLFGIDVMEGTRRALITGNDVSGGWASISVGDAGSAQLRDNAVAAAATPLVVDGVAMRDREFITSMGKYFKWNPLLILWTAILGVPSLWAVKALVSRTVRRRQMGPVLP